VRDDIRAGQICATVAAAHGAKDVSAADFFETIEKPKKPKQSVEEMQATLRRAFGGNVVNRGRDEPDSQAAGGHEAL
jgi:hypothetical protein